MADNASLRHARVFCATPALTMVTRTLLSCKRRGRGAAHLRSAWTLGGGRLAGPCLLAAWSKVIHQPCSNELVGRYHLSRLPLESNAGFLNHENRTCLSILVNNIHIWHRTTCRWLSVASCVCVCVCVLITSRNVVPARWPTPPGRSTNIETHNNGSAAGLLRKRRT